MASLARDGQVLSRTTLTMSSREIAELVESRHVDVKRTIERLMSKDVIAGYAPMAYTHPQNGQSYDEYRVNQRDSYVIVAQLSPEFTARLVDRWQELEAQAAKPPAPALPTDYLSALKALVTKIANFADLGNDEPSFSRLGRYGG